MPLYVRIMLFLFLNLAVAVLLLSWVLKTYYGIGKEDIIANTVEARMSGMTQLLIPALNGAEKSEWESILEQTGRSNGVELAIYRPDGSKRHAGSERALPQEITVFLEQKFPRPDRRSGREPRGGDGPPPNRPFDPLMDDGPEGRPGPPPRRPEGNRPRRHPVKEGMAEVEMIGKYGSPKQDIAVVHFWIKARENEPNDLMLIVWKLDGASPLFFSWKPLFYCFLGLLVITAILWVPFVTRLTRRLGILTQGAESISEGNFEIDVASDRSDELGRLSRSIQRMAIRLDDYVAGQKRFLGDIAHELCSPLVRIRMGMGVLEHQLEKEELSKLANINEEVEELSQLVNELLDFSKASMKQDTLELESVDLRQLCELVVSREGVGADVSIDVPEELVLKSRHDLLRRAIGNLVRNAVRYAGKEGDIQVRAATLGDSVSITVEDKGPGLPESWLEKVFEPFSRPDEARAREAGGSGLGMAIAKTCITSLGGEIHCENRKSGGLRVVIRLPHE
ncbi:hypothetical protein NT6N_18820 [Oceaniferula spumae]|uniref:histidine kinase n=1 Tax=Oceaniferula spumae TaxID=2979115 RepID=A0AAT9FLN1_9BACT